MKHKNIRRRILLALIIGMAVMTAAFILISYGTFREYEIRDCVEYSKGLTGLISEEILDANKVDEYLEKGRGCLDYSEVEQKLYHLRDAYPDIVFLYVYQVREDGFHVVFDLDTQDTHSSEPGDIEPFEYFPSFEKYIPDLLAGKEIPAVESHEFFGHLLTVYTPLYDADGACKCYIGADCSMEALKEYNYSVIKQILLFFLAVLALVLTVSFLAADRGVIRKMDTLENRAYRDTLTGLQNRTAFYEYCGDLNKRIAGGGKGDFSTLMIDVNYLKRMNDVYGHEQGNVYLQEAAELIRKVFGGDRVYRVGGDEFVVLLEGREQEGAEQRIRAFKEEIARRQADESLQPWEKVSAAAGIAAFEKDRESTVEETLRRADEAMYRDKVAMKAERKD